MTRQLQLLTHLAANPGDKFAAITAALAVKRNFACDIVGKALKAGLVRHAGERCQYTYHLTEAGSRRHKFPPAPIRRSTPKES